MRILIVDDNADIRSLIRVILESGGHTVVGEAEDGKSALKAFKDLRPEMVLLDIIMPGRSGVEVLEDIRGIDPAAKIIIVTAVEQDSINRRLLLRGADGIIYKPFHPEDFEKAFKGVLHSKPPQAEKSDTIEKLAAGGLSRCMLRTSDASTWAWELCEVAVSSGKILDAVKRADFGPAAASVQINLRLGSPFAAALLVRSADIEFISGCFVSGPLYCTKGLDLHEVLVIEIGNIILNALVNPLLGALKKSALPSVPMLIKGGPGAVAAGLGSCLDLDLDYRIIAASIAMRRDGRLARAGVLCVLPEELAAGLEKNAESGAGAA